MTTTLQMKNQTSQGVSYLLFGVLARDLLLSLPQPAQLRQLLQLVCRASFSRGRQRAIDFQQRHLIIRQTKRVFLGGQAQKIIGRSVQTPADLANEVQAQPSSAVEIIVERRIRDLQLVCKSFLRNVLFLHKFAYTLDGYFHVKCPFAAVRCLFRQKTVASFLFFSSISHKIWA